MCYIEWRSDQGDAVTHSLHHYYLPLLLTQILRSITWLNIGKLRNLLSISEAIDSSSFGRLFVSTP